MKTIAALLFLPLLIAFVTWVSVRAINSGATRFDEALDRLDRIVETEAALHRDVLSTRAGLLRNYDPLVRETNALDTEVARLRASMVSDAAATAAIDRLAENLARQEDRVEQFKSINALLRNSLAYFAMFSANLTRAAQDNSLALPVSMLAASMLRLTLDTSPNAVLAVQTRLDQLARQIPPDTHGPAAALLAHGQLLHDLLPDADSLLRSLCSTPHKADQAAVRTVLLARQTALHIESRRFRFVLYITSLCLAGLLAWTGLRLRHRSHAMRRRAAFEHALAAISMRFVAAHASDLDTVIDEALRQMALCVGAERAYFLGGDPPGRVYRWSEPGIGFAAGWPTTALSISKSGYPSFGGVTQVVRLRQLSPGADRDALAAAGLQGWACVVAGTTDGSNVLLGFDAVTHPCRIMREGELGLLRMALDTVANALGRRTLEQERLRLESQLHQARRLETIGALASGIAHNFNNIVGAILGYTEMASETDASPGALEEIRRAGERARELIDQILCFAGRREARRGPVDMHALIAEAASLLRASLPPTVELAVRHPSMAMVVSGVHSQLLQVVLNLCNNAAQAMSHTGRVALELTSEDVQGTRSLSHGTLPPGRYLCIAVTDHGSGIDGTALNRIFKPFFTTRTTGNGLGLATVWETVREHDGAMHVQSTPAHGSRFEVWLPCIDVPAPAAYSEPARFIFGHGETVLVLEADADRLMQDEELLAAVGYEPVGFTRTENARVAYLTSPQRFDAAMVGHVWPPEGILGFTAALRRTTPELPILLATSAKDAFGAAALVGAGISEVVTWPIKAAEIATALHEYLRPASPRQVRLTAGSATDPSRLSAR
jgi:signal transduction histidine kinase/CheY-like chemotaxis protein